MGRLSGEQKQLRDNIKRPVGTLAWVPAHSVTTNKYRGPVMHMERDGGGHRINLLPAYRPDGNQQTLQDFPAALGDPEHTGRPHGTEQSAQGRREPEEPSMLHAFVHQRRRHELGRLGERRAPGRMSHGGERRITGQTVEWVAGHYQSMRTSR